MRLRLSNEVADVINEFGPKIYDDFDQVGFSSLSAVVWVLILIVFSSVSWFQQVLPPPPIRESGDGRAAWDK
jgi:hypothetical protein